jgi:hypothetical protein
MSPVQTLTRSARWAGAIVLLVVTIAQSALTTDACLAKKRTAWRTLRKCQASEDVKRLGGKAADPGKCQTAFDLTLAKIDDKAAEAAIACRYGDDGGLTVTDYDTGLMWEKKDGTVGGICFFPADAVHHCVNSVFYWDSAQAYVASTSPANLVVLPFLADHADWRLPTIAELMGIFDPGAPGCGTGNACIDPIFGATVPSVYFSSTTAADDSNGAWCVSFGTGDVARCAKDFQFAVRAVRGSL